MMRTGTETPEEEKARFAVTRAFAKRVKEMLGDAPEHRLRARRQGDVPDLRLHREAVRQGRHLRRDVGLHLDFDVRYLWMRQKEIIGSHFANAWECTKANQLIDDGLIRPVLWKTMGFDQVAEAHQLMHENKHLGKIAILVGATEEGQGASAEGPGAIRAEVGA